MNYNRQYHSRRRMYYNNNNGYNYQRDGNWHDREQNNYEHDRPQHHRHTHRGYLQMRPNHKYHANKPYYQKYQTHNKHHRSMHHQNHHQHHTHNHQPQKCHSHHQNNYHSHQRQSSKYESRELRNKHQNLKPNKSASKHVVISKEVTVLSVHKKQSQEIVFHDPEHEMAIKYNDIKHAYNNNVLLEHGEKYRLTAAETENCINEYNHARSACFDDDGNVCEPDSDSDSDIDVDSNINVGFGPLKDTRPRLITETTSDLRMTVNDNNDENLLQNDHLTQNQFEQFTARNYYKQVQMVPDDVWMNGQDLMNNAIVYNSNKMKKKRKKKRKKEKRANIINEDEFDIFGGSSKKEKRQNRKTHHVRPNKTGNNNKENMMISQSRADEQKCKFIVDHLNILRQQQIFEEKSILPS